MQLCWVEDFFNIFVVAFGRDLYSAITPKSEDKYVVKVFNWSEFHLFVMTLLQNPYFSNLTIGLRLNLFLGTKTAEANKSLKTDANGAHEQKD